MKLEVVKLQDVAIEELTKELVDLIDQITAADRLVDNPSGKTGIVFTLNEEGLVLEVEKIYLRKVSKIMGGGAIILSIIKFAFGFT